MPLFTVAFYYGVTGPWQRTQVEAVVGFPLFLSIYFALKAEESGSRPSAIHLSLSGFLGAIVLLFKFVFFPIVLSVWAIALIYVSTHIEDAKAKPRLVLQWVLFIALGLSLPLLTTAGYFALHGALHELLWVTFEYPRRAVTLLYERRFNVLRSGHFWFLQRCAPSMALAVVALCPSTVKRLDPLNRNLLLWIICGSAVIQLQVLSWWSYHYVLLFTPLGILAARGVDTLWTHARNQWIELSRLRIALSLAMAIGFLYSPVLYALGYNTLDALRQGVPVTKSQLRKIQISRDESSYREMLEDVQFLNEPSSAPALSMSAAHTFTIYYRVASPPFSSTGGPSGSIFPSTRDHLLIN